ncbi:MAG: hypothetical protein D4R76_06395 [Methylococcus sp.]|nr:MAG: hypothetical protein D4R76_06395 [Methylococcus sp.]
MPVKITRERPVTLKIYIDAMFMPHDIPQKRCGFAVSLAMMRRSMGQIPQKHAGKSTIEP